MGCAACLLHTLVFVEKSLLSTEEKKPRAPALLKIEVPRLTKHGDNSSINAQSVCRAFARTNNLLGGRRNYKSWRVKSCFYNPTFVLRFMLDKLGRIEDYLVILTMLALTLGAVIRTPVGS